MTRRTLLKAMSGVAATAAARPANGYAGEARLSMRRLALIEEVQRRACRYFYQLAHPTTGLVLDRARIIGFEDRPIASIAATGFGLSALCIAAQRGFMPAAAARLRIENTLEFFAHRAFQQHGFFYHFMEAETGARAYKCEISSVDTAWLLCGVLHARQQFDTRQIRRLSAEILDRVDWRWMWAGGPTLCHGWTPEKGFLEFRWDEYSELLAMYLLALGSKNFSIPVHGWHAWARPKVKCDDGELFIQSRAPLFVHQYSHAWFDFRGQRDAYADYFENSRIATRQHRNLCLSLRQQYPWIDESMWGITASDSRAGYKDWGGPASYSKGKIDGTVVPCASGGSLVFMPEECSLVLETMIERYGKSVWTHYGFVDAFHPGVEWYGPDVLGIDLGIMLLMAENLRSESVWKAIMSSDEVVRGFRRAGFTRV